MEFGDPLQLAKLFLLVALIIICSATDVRARRVPNSVLLPALLASLFLNSLADGLTGLVDSLAGLAIGLLMLMPFHLLGRMGAGDIKLLGVVGSVLGAWGATVAGLATMMAGAILGIVYLAWLVVKPAVISRVSQLVQRLSGNAEAPPDLLPGQIGAAEIPYAIAIAGGTLAALLYLDLLTEIGIT